jgi:hypothetical protein
MGVPAAARRGAQQQQQQQQQQRHAHAWCSGRGCPPRRQAGTQTPGTRARICRCGLHSISSRTGLAAPCCRERRRRRCCCCCRCARGCGGRGATARCGCTRHTACPVAWRPLTTSLLCGGDGGRRLAPDGLARDLAPPIVGCLEAEAVWVGVWSYKRNFATHTRSAGPHGEQLAHRCARVSRCEGAAPAVSGAGCAAVCCFGTPGDHKLHASTPRI